MAGVRGAILGVCAAGLLGAAAHSRAGAGDDDWATGQVRIEGFEVEPVERIEPGAQLAFTVYGSPGATATLRIDGARAPLALREVYGGVYEGRYVVRFEDRIAPRASVTAALRRGADLATARLEDPLVEGGSLAKGDPQAAPALAGRPVPPTARVEAAPAAPVARRVPPAANPEPATACASCGVVEAVDAVEPARRSLAGWFAAWMKGQPIPPRSASMAHYDVRVRLPDGRTQVWRYTGSPPPWRPGDVVPLDALQPLSHAGGSERAEQRF